MAKPARRPEGLRALDRLAERCGILASFKDARGQAREAPEQTIRALLAAMDVAAGEDAEVRASLEELEHREWSAPLPPVHVVNRAAGRLTVPVTVRAGTRRMAWSLRLEDGAELAGHAPIESLPLLAQRKLAGGIHERRNLVLPADLADGYHHLTVGLGESPCLLIVSPGQCWLPPALEQGRRLWGVAAQLYLLRSQADWGIGDYSDLTRLVEMLLPLGADVIGLNPLHALFPDDPEHASPYSPASRLLLNVLNIDVDAVAELTGTRSILETVSGAALERCRAAREVQYSAIAALKLAALESIFEHCLAVPDASHWESFAAFRRRGGEALERGCLFFALREHRAQTQGDADWHTWPEGLRTPASPAVQRFAEEHRVRITFHAWLQFLADQQLAEAARSARGMAIGLYRDLAVGADPEGAETWSDPAAVIGGAHVGAPPDIYNPAGQDWGLPPFNPRELRSQGYRHFIALVRANMRHAGGLRIDHVMGLQQLYWVPVGASPAQGAYVRYPLDDLLGILALESQRNRCLVVGEDLGTVPEGFRERLAQAAVFSYRVLFFERNERGFVAPERYPALALAVVGSHDLPTLRSWWGDRDLRLKEALQLYPSNEEAERARTERARDRAELEAAFRRAGIATGELAAGGELFRAAHRFLARTACALAIAQLDDLTDEVEPVNVPTTSAEYPNWRRRLSATLEEIARSPRLAELARLFEEYRGRSPRGSPAIDAPQDGPR